MKDGRILKPSRPLGTPDYLIWEKNVITKDEYHNASDYSLVLIYLLGCPG